MYSYLKSKKWRKANIEWLRPRSTTDTQKISVKISAIDIFGGAKDRGANFLFLNYCFSDIWGYFKKNPGNITSQFSGVQTKNNSKDHTSPMGMKSLTKIQKYTREREITWSYTILYQASTCR